MRLSYRTNGQATTAQGNGLSDASCLVDPDPQIGDWHQAGASNCVNAGVERNGSCNICQTPWVDRYGAHRLDWEDRLSNGGTSCPVVDCSLVPTPAGCVAMQGDDIPDIGPSEL